MQDTAVFYNCGSGYAYAINQHNIYYLHNQHFTLVIEFIGRHRVGWNFNFYLPIIINVTF